MTGIPRNVIPSVAERSLLHCDNQHVCTEKKRWLGAASHVAMSVLQGGSLGCASDDDGAKRYQNFAALRSFDSVLLSQISHFLTYDVFPAQDDEMRCTFPAEPVEPTEPLSQRGKGQNAQGANPEPSVPC